jgi:hypothetical protein
MTTPLRTTDTAPARRLPAHGRAPVGVRRLGYGVSIVLNAALIYAMIWWPGWWVVPFLTDQTVLVLPIVVASLIAGIVVNATWIFADPPWWRALGDAVTGAFVVAAAARLWLVFPFDFGDQQAPWDLLAHIFLGVITIGTAIGVVVAFGRFVASAVRPDRNPPT